ncbi:recombination-associated protein RdgC [Variovorax gossypii]
MSINNATVYRFSLASPEAFTLAAVEEALKRSAFLPCGPTAEESSGWEPPRGEANGAFVESIDGQWIARYATESRTVPGSVLRRKVDERCAHIEATTGRKPGKKEKKELKEDVLLELLPMAFTKRGAVTVWLSRNDAEPGKSMLLIDTSSQGRADAIVTSLVKCLEGFSVALLQTATAPSAAMAQWLLTQEPPVGFTVDREVELRATDDSKAVVRYGNHPLDIDEVRGHIESGKTPTRLALTWDDRVSFELTSGMTLRKIKLLEGTGDGAPGGKKEDNFDADVAIATGELGLLIPALIEGLGGEGAFSGGKAVTNEAERSEAEAAAA